jgi:hypothetical protein
MNADRVDVLAEGEQLLLAAFRRARDAGHPEWRRMRSPVLKNRLLDQTSRQFSETRWGVEKFKDFLALFPHLVSVDASTPPFVELIGEGPAREHAVAAAHAPAAHAPAPQAAASPLQRVRADLWQAVMNFRSDEIYVWDADSGRAVATTDDADARPRLPTIDANTLVIWRAEFAAEEWSKADMPREAIETWLAEQGAASLPRYVNWRWIAALKQKVTDRLVGWFADQGIDPPDDLLEAAPISARPRGDSDRLRLLAQRTVAVMTPSELAALQLPAGAVLRALRNDSSR